MVTKQLYRVNLEITHTTASRVAGPVDLRRKVALPVPTLLFETAAFSLLRGAIISEIKPMSDLKQSAQKTTQTMQFL